MQTQAAARALSAIDPNRGRAEAALKLRAENRNAEALELLSLPGEYTQDAYTLRGDLQAEAGQLHEAVGSYSTVIALDPENMYAHRNLASCLHRLGRWAAAAEAYRKILEFDSYSDAARIGLGDCLLHLDKPEEALASFESCWSGTAFRPALFGKAAALHLLRRFDEAEGLYQRYLEVDPESEEAFRNLIALSLEVFDLTRLERYAQDLLRLNPESAIALQGLTLVAFERRSFTNAAGYYVRLLEIVPKEELFHPGDGDVLEYRLNRKCVELLERYGRNLPQRPWRANR